MLKNGKWDAEWHPVQGTDELGRFVRQTSSFRDWVTADGAPGPEGQVAFPAERDRYHLYVAYICPWASRALILRALKRLETVISVTALEPVLTDQGWRFGDFPGSSGADPFVGATYLHEIYSHSNPQVSGRATVPVLWDKKRRKIVNNESADIVRILNESFDLYGDASVNLRPADLLTGMTELNGRLYEALNNGVYKAGFASSQAAYEEALRGVFGLLDDLEKRLADGRSYLFGERLTESDVRLFVTLIRFDAAYVTLFKCNLRQIADYRYLQDYLKRLYRIPAFRQSVSFDHIKAGYASIKALNPTGIIPAGPDLSALDAA